MAPPKKYTPEVVGEIIRAYVLDGESQLTLAKRYNTSKAVISAQMRQAGYEGRSLSEAARLREAMGRGKCRIRSAA